MTGFDAVDTAGYADHTISYQKQYLQNLKALSQCQEVHLSKLNSKVSMSASFALRY